MISKTMKRIQAVALSLALLPAGGAFAVTTHHHRHSQRYSHSRNYNHRHHYSQTRGVVVGAVAGAAIDHHQPLKGALIGGALGGAVQAVRNHKH